MLEEVFGTAGRLPEMQVSGMTDLQIVAEALRDEGFTHETIRERVPELREHYMEAMRTVTGNGNDVFELLPGVRETLAAVHEHQRYHSALMTGNIKPAAYFEGGTGRAFRVSARCPAFRKTATAGEPPAVPVKSVQTR
jgi:hypothetical protein